MSNETFSIGEIAVLTFSLHPAWPAGMEVTIHGPLELNDKGIPVYQIGWEGAARIMSWAHCLRKRRPPSYPLDTYQPFKKTRWDDCDVWRPAGVRA